jgi:hypothetical protein
VTATLTVDRSALSLPDLVIGVDIASGYTLDPKLRIGDVIWRKETSEAPNVPGRTLGDFTRASTEVVGSITCHGSSEANLQSLLGTLIAALTQVTASGFAPFPMTYTHGTATVYRWTCTEPGDLTLGDQSGLDDAELASFVQAVGFTVVRDPIPLAGPI